MRHVVARSAAPSKPLTEPVFWILLSLAGQPRHGYALMKDVETLSEGRVRLTTGTLYGALSRMLGDNWIERAESTDTSRDKQAYRLTPAGRTRLRNETARLTHVARVAKARLKARET